MKMQKKAIKVVAARLYWFYSDDETVKVSMTAHTKYSTQGQTTDIMATNYLTGQDYYTTLQGELSEAEAKERAEKIIAQMSVAQVEGMR